MAVPEQIRHLLSRWCADRVPDADREHRQISYTTQGDEITILDRRPPAYPQLDATWSATPIALLRLDDPAEGGWSLYLPGEEVDDWRRAGEPGTDPIQLLDDLLA